MTTKLDQVAAINAQLVHADLPSYTQVLETLRYLRRQAQLGGLPETNGAMHCAARIERESSDAMSNIY